MEQINKRRQQSLDLYYTNPNICLKCKKVITVRKNEKACNAKQRKFCNSTCFAIYNNSHRKRQRKSRKSKECIDCLTPIHKSYTRCTQCKNVKKRNEWASQTKGQLFAKSKSWQNARSAIVKHAKWMFNRESKKTTCHVCSYNNFIDVCHIKPVSKFSDDTTISIINAPENLIGLCPNHHREFDKDLLTL